MASEVRSGLVGFVLGLGTGLATAFLQRSSLDNDRPVIRVRNPEITFETERNWVEKMSGWHLEDPDGESVDYFVVTIEKPDGQPKMLVGEQVFIDYTDSIGPQTFEIGTFDTGEGKKHPRLHPASPLKHEPSNRKKLKSKAMGKITKIRVPGGERAFASSDSVKIKIRPHNGS